MAWSVIREATQEDRARLLAAGERFCQHHGLEVDRQWQTPTDRAEAEASHYPGESQERKWLVQHLKPLWRAAVQRALREPNATGIAWGTVGFHVG